jgi:hypothetical protein
MRRKGKKTQLDDAEFERQVKQVLESFAFGAQRSAPARKRQSRPRRSQPPRRVLTLDEATLEFQRKFVLAALEQHQIAGRWNIRATARALDITPYRLYRCIRRLGLPQRTMSDLQRADDVSARRAQRAVPEVKERDASTIDTVVAAEPLRPAADVDGCDALTLGG